jgi:hypothetical protein
MVIDLFDWSDLQVGDTIRRTERVESGTQVVKTGTIAYFKYGTAYDKDNNVLVESTDFRRAPVWPDVRVELAHRPDKPLWEQAEVGDMIIAWREGAATGKKYIACYYKTEKGWVLPFRDELIHLEQLKKYLAEETKIELRRCRNGNAD